MTGWVVFGIIFFVLAMVFLGYAYREYRQAQERRNHFHIEYREVHGKKVGIQIHDDDNPHMADVIAETLRTGKPVAGHYDENGNFSMETIDHE